MHNSRRVLNAVMPFAVIPVLLAIAMTTTTTQAARSTRPANRQAHAATAPAGGGGRTATTQMLRGHYIVFGVARCSDCHTPRDENGSLIDSRLLMGAPTPFLPVRPTPDWPVMSPRIAGTLPGTDEEMVRLLTTGVWKNGERLRPPMPQFRMTREDAEAVVAFLKSLAAF